MLEPHGRTLLFDVLKPPPDHVLDAAVATTYTLDLTALLTAPVAFSLFDAQDHGELLSQDSLTLLESLRRYAGKITLFCHAGAISLPRVQFPQFEFLENSIVECRPRRRKAAFHPKLWVLRFAGPDGLITYRLVCGTRNLTFDRCWDTVVTLEGPLIDRRNAIAVNHPLGDLVQALPGLATCGVADATRQRIEMIAAEIRRVAFVAPEGFELAAFHPFGIEGYQADPVVAKEGRLLIISPFVSQQGIDRLVKGRPSVSLVSRPESLSQPGLQVPDSVTAFVLANGTDDEADDTAVESAVDTTRGLHAKCYVVESGWKSHVFTGSLNATDALANGNVEFMVELVGSRNHNGIDTLFERQDNKTCLGDLLQPFTPLPAGGEDALETGERAALEQIRDAIVDADLSARVSGGPSAFSMWLGWPSPLPSTSVGVAVRCWPVTLGQGWAVTVAPGTTHAEFLEVSLEAISAFIAFELKAGDWSEVFVRHVPLVGAPADRRERLLRGFLKDKQRVMRFLFLLLADDGDWPSSTTVAPTRGANGDGAATLLSSSALLESLLRALHRDPVRLDAVARLLDDINQQEQGKELLPPEFDSVWAPVWKARQELT